MYHSKEVSLDNVLMDGIQDMVFITRVGEDGEFYYAFLNNAAMKATGLDQTVVGKSIITVYEKDTATFLYEQYQQVVVTSNGVIYEDSYVSSACTKKYSETKLTPLFDDDGKCTKIVAVVRDITEKKQAELEMLDSRKLVNESEQRLRSLIEYNADGILTVDLNGKVVTANTEAENITGYTSNEIIGSLFNSLVTTGDKNKVYSYFYQALGGIAKNFRITIKNKIDEYIFLEVKFVPIVVSLKVTGVYVIFRDITDSEQLLKKYKESENRFRIIAENSHDLITLLDKEGQIIYVSPSYKDVLGYDYTEYVGKSFIHNVHPDEQNCLEESFLLAVGKGERWHAQFKQKHHSNGWIWSELNGTPVFDEDNRFMHMVVLSRDITLQKEHESRLKHFAYHDYLTLLPNRRYLEEHLQEALQHVKEKQDGLAVMMLDIDLFKAINDQMGHDVGDRVIEEFAIRVSQNIRSSDMVARLGGDEFVIILPGIGTEENALQIGEKIKNAIAEPWHIKNYEFNVTTSIGISMVPDKNATVSSVLKKADIALYEAKHSGRNSCKMANSEFKFSKK